MLLVFEEAVHLDDVGMIEIHLDFDFSAELIHYLLLYHQRFVDHFERTYETTGLLSRLDLMYLAKKTFPYFPQPRFRTSSKFSSVIVVALLLLLGVFFIQVFFFYSSLKD